MKLTLLLSIAGLVSAATNYKNLMMNADSEKTFDENQIFEQMGVGSMGIYLNPLELNNLMGELGYEFPEVIKRFTVGFSYQGKRMYGYLVGLDLDTKEATMAKPAILIDGAHHARELSSMEMSVYTVLRLLYGYVKEEPNVLYLL